MVEQLTDRLSLRPWGDQHTEEFVQLCADPRVMQYINEGRPLVREEAARISIRAAGLWKSHGFGPWAAYERSSQQFTGRIGLNLLEDWPGPDKWEVGWELRPAFWGHGLATEGGRAAVEFGFGEAQLPRLISVTVPENLASRRVMEKVGLTYQGRLAWRDTAVVWYAADARTRSA